MSDAPSHIVRRDTACAQCNYNLVGLSLSAQCPECGLHVAQSIRTGLPPGWTVEHARRFARGAALLKWSMILLLLVPYGTAPLYVIGSWTVTSRRTIAQPPRTALHIVCRSLLGLIALGSADLILMRSLLPRWAMTLGIATMVALALVHHLTLLAWMTRIRRLWTPQAHWLPKWTVCTTWAMMALVIAMAATNMVQGSEVADWVLAIGLAVIVAWVVTSVMFFEQTGTETRAWLPAPSKRP